MFFEAVVENNVHDKKNAKVQIRIIGDHTDNRSVSNNAQYYPVEDLPWAEVCMPPTSPQIDGQSDFGGLLKGTVVYGFYKDPDKQHPVIIGVAVRIPEEQPDFEKGFSDPDKQYPSADFLGESPLNRLARNEKVDETPSHIKKEDVDEASGDVVSFTEPSNPYAAEYPNNRVIATKHHIIELDDTDGAERINIYHKSGSFEEIHPDGQRVEKTVSKKYEIILNDNNIHITGDQKVLIDGKYTLEAGSDGLMHIKSVGNFSCQGINLDGIGGKGDAAQNRVVHEFSPCPAFGFFHLQPSDTVKVSP